MDVYDVCTTLLIQAILFFLLFILVNIGQNSPGNNNTPNQQTTPSQPSGINLTQQATAIPIAVNLPGVNAGNLDFSTLGRSFGDMAQRLAGRLGATLANPTPATGPSTSNTSTQNSNSSTNTTTTNNNETDTVTEQMLGGEINRLVCMSQMRLDFF